MLVLQRANTFPISLFLSRLAHEQTGKELYQPHTHTSIEWDAECEIGHSQTDEEEKTAKKKEPTVA